MPSSSPTETIECPLCAGMGRLKRSEVLDRLGVKDFARVAHLSAEEAFRLLQSKHDREHQTTWSRFEVELAKRTAEIREHHKDELRLAQSEKDSLARRIENCLNEVAKLREQNQELEGEMAKVARVGRKEELDFAAEVQTWAGVYLERVTRNGDFVLSYRDPSGAPLEPRVVIDNKDKATVSEGDIKKLIRDTKERHSPVGIIVAREESQLRQHDRERRWGQEDGVWILRTTRQWLPRDLDVLKPLFERMRIEGADFLQKNSALAEEVRRTFVDLDEVEKELKRAAKAIDTVSDLTAKYRGRLQALCDTATSAKIAPKPERDGGSREQFGA
jgi:predicted  nucleic acid-binding Zn-ribbon protein